MTIPANYYITIRPLKHGKKEAICCDINGGAVLGRVIGIDKNQIEEELIAMMEKRAKKRAVKK